MSANVRNALLPPIVWLLAIACGAAAFGQDGGNVPAADADGDFASTDVEFSSTDGVAMFGRLTLPKTNALRAIVIYVQTAEGATVDQRRPLPNGTTFNYFDLYREHLTARNIGFFSYEGRGIRLGDAPPRYEQVDRDVFNTGTLDNKVADVLSAISAVRSQPGLRDAAVFLMGASEGTLLAAEAASRDEAAVDGLILYGVLASIMKENFAYIMSDGAFLPYRPLDADGNDSISREEWEHAIKNVPFEKADLNGDGQFTVDDMRVVNRMFLDAIENDDFPVLNEWGKAHAGVALPQNWFQDHFAHAEMWTFLQHLDVPVGLFHGDRDNMASPAAVKELERKATEAQLAKLEFHYFDGLDHTLNIGEYFVADRMPPGHQAIFEFIDRIAPGREGD